MLPQQISDILHKKYAKGIIITILAIFISIISYQLIFKPKPVNLAALPAVTTFTATLKDMPIMVTEVGTVMPLQSVAVKSRVDSQITEILFKDGDLIQEQQPLFKLDDRELLAELAAAKADYEKEKAVLTNLKVQYERIAKIAKSGYESQSNLDQAQSNYDAQIALVASKQAMIDNLQVQVGYCTIDSPISGKAGIIKVTLGNEVKANDTQALVIINQIDPIKVEFSLAQKYFDQLIAVKNSDKVKIFAIKPDEKNKIAGELKYLDNQINPGSDSIIIGAEFANKGQDLWPGMYVNIEVVLEELSNAVVVPNNAVQNGQNNTKYVYVIKDDIAHKRNVTVKAIVDDEVVIAEGLEKDENVAIDGVEKLTDGGKVKVITA